MLGQCWAVRGLSISHQDHYHATPTITVIISSITIAIITILL